MDPSLSLVLAVDMDKYIKVDDICPDLWLNRYFVKDRFSLIDLFNNLDHDDRAVDRGIKRVKAGKLLALAGLNRKIHLMDDGKYIPHRGEAASEFDIDYLYNTLDEEFGKLLIEVSYDLMSYLFHRTFVNRTYPVHPEDVDESGDDCDFESVYRVSEDILWSTLSHLSESILDLADVETIYNHSTTSDLSAYIVDDFIIIDIFEREKSIDADDDFSLRNLVIDRGIINATGFKNLHRYRR